ncbi:ABC transporter permease [Micromonospora sp. WMMD961]|uniref:ABC transporter permease n=1 Tax=Micromonospora sp. WMMD961 TaxID=3016100 RepID=UPI00241812A5|nr:ABC transporter permease [Micromonospora sp. WMMD961]MDG4782220.1 ABC transporter permease [Micromonospora sp. WMMD961]
MSAFEVLRFAVRGIGANKLRSSLTMLGILIGVAAVILLVAVGNGSARQVAERIEALGTKTLTVQGVGGSGVLTPALAEALNDPVLAPDVASVSPVASTQATLTYQGADHSVQQLVGSSPSYFTASNSPVGAGAAFTADDVAQGRPVLVIGRTVADELFPGVEAVGKEITVNGALFTVIGVLGEKSSASGFMDANDVAIAPLTAVQQALTGYGPLTSIVVEARTPEKVTDAQSQVSLILSQRIQPPAASNPQPYRIQNASQLLQTQSETADTFTTLLGAVAGISLLVGGIGITNIMLVTVTERTREIGIRKALGAPRRVILTQFLAEATMLSLLGGGLGVATAFIGGNFTIVGVRPVIVPSSVALALCVSVAIGLFFGSVPAHRAAGLRPIDALRYE